MPDKVNEGKKVRNQINASMSEEDMEILEKLKKIYGINVSAIVKLGIRKLLTEGEEETRNANHSRERV